MAANPKPIPPADCPPEIVKIDLMDLIVGNYLERHGLKVVGTNQTVDGVTWPPRLYLAPSDDVCTQTSGGDEHAE